MPKILFSDLKIKNIKPQHKTVNYYAAGREYGDRSLGLRVSPKGKKTFFLLYYSGGKTVRYTIGSYPAISLKDARAIANDHRTGDPLQERHDAQRQQKSDREASERFLANQKTMTDLWVAYQEKLSVQRKKKAATTTKEELRKWEVIIKPKIGKMAVADVTPAILSDILKDFAKVSPVNANRLHSLLSVLFKPALEQGWITTHPLQWISKPGGAEPPRKRVLTDDEIRILWPLFGQLQSQAGDILKLLLLTAQRPGEIMSMLWSDVDLDAKTWTQSSNKTESAHIVPMSDPVVDIISARQRGTYVFASEYKKNHSDHTKCTQAARTKLKMFSGVTDWTAHDCRRTARTLMSRLQIKHHVRERVLNHSQGGIVGVYDQFDYLQEKTDAMDKLGREINRILGIKSLPSKVIQMRVG
jgi:integrase